MCFYINYFVRLDVSLITFPRSKKGGFAVSKPVVDYFFHCMVLCWREGWGGGAGRYCL